MRYSIPNGFPVFYFDGDLYDATGPKLFDYAMHKAAESGAKMLKARKKGWWLERQALWMERAGEVAAFYKLKRKIDAAAVDKLAKRIATERTRQAKAGRERQAKIEKDNAETVQRWLIGETIQFPYAVQRVYLRLSIDTGTKVTVVETSKGVIIPISDAERAFRFAIARRSKGWHRNGDTFAVGQYQLDAINEQGIVAGCHRFDWQEIERFAKLNGWMK